MTTYIKYPRTLHLPWSLGVSDDDKMLKSCDIFSDKRVIVTEKLDGENTTMMRDKVHARSVDSGYHPSRTWVKNFWSNIARDIPEGWRICGENVYAQHAIHYDNLSSYFYGFSVWDHDNHCLSWDDSQTMFNLLGIEPVPVLYDGIFDEYKIRELWADNPSSSMEGYVIRIADGYDYPQFSTSIGKFVRKGHTNDGDDHWLYGNAPIIKNRLV